MRSVRSWLRLAALRRVPPLRPVTIAAVGPSRHKSDDISRLFVPVPIQPSQSDDINSVGSELAGKLVKPAVLRILNKFYQRPKIRRISLENGLDTYLFHQAYVSFRRYCVETAHLPPDLHIIFSDILRDAGHTDDLIPYFLRHARTIFPHLECMDDLKKISDLREPANWYPEARAINRRIVFHMGPTNSGKTFHALQRFMAARSGVYCGPLKLLAAEVFEKCNGQGTSCDLVTGEERRLGRPDGLASEHVACTVEMTSVKTPYEVAVIDEIQLLRDPQRGWAWTRALLGVAAEEVHLCGEPAALELIQEMALCCGEEVEVRRYKRLSPLVCEDTALESTQNVRPGDCIVCFSKNDIYQVSREIERLGHECAVIYGGLPPGAKLAQARRFNDPDDPCKILVATDAIGMGLNLSIRRIIFHSLMKPTINEKGEKEIDVISCSQARQIAGRAGRHGTQWEEGTVTTMKSHDLPTLQRLLEEEPPPLEAAGLQPTADQIELYAYHLPNATLSNLMDIFVNLSTVDDSLYFMCQTDSFKFLADMIQHVPLPLRVRYVFCCSPIDRKIPFICNMFLKFARQYSRNEPITVDWLCSHVGWPFTTPATILDLVHLEHVFDVLDLYLWLSYRFMDLFPAADEVREMQAELDATIQEGVANIVQLLKNTEAGGASSSAAARVDDEDRYTASRRQQAYLQNNDDSDESARLGKLSKRLLSQGLLTHKMMEELHQEWEKNRQKSSPSTGGRGEGKSRKRR
ncbi:ATP-dependent RNA helicase SUV3 homolog, mitochondrial-like [Amphibalanus amphitrite]|uniref:ATP-dependent RNA helicase SUV3 homolog, mitochondrial-like n=1 Tax=Amphibalanus amphitrite TaxID=1232801 RepID=UPI001C901A96|nr:ATP-dependent RNA helicase SUV3 homolog, mitochondrial-like [Amphibalanus amphitrite]XP_043219385.1 ATP-dependent RNA helicase SUV3 homolog, mitochondrial-like [Amphibalanus amphitrite]